MMVTVRDGGGILKPLFQSLEDTTFPQADRIDAYLRLADHLRSEDLAQVVKEVCEFTPKLKDIMMGDMKSTKSTQLSQATLLAVGYCLHQESIASAFSDDDSKAFIEGLCDVICTATDKSACTRALWCIAKQKFPHDIMSSHLKLIFVSLEKALVSGNSFTVENESLDVISRLLEQMAHKEMTDLADCWGKLVLPLLISTATKVREAAVTVLEQGLPCLVAAQWNIEKESAGLINSIENLFADRKELYVLRVWNCLVAILGKTLHKGGNLINTMLKLAERAFKNPSAEVQVMAYRSWSCLIDNFALSPDRLCTSKRIKLLMTPFLNSASKEKHNVVEMARMQTWWHMVCCFGDRINTHFDQVCAPLLHYLFNTTLEDTSSKSRDGFTSLHCPATPSNNPHLSKNLATTPTSVNRALQGLTPKTPTVINGRFTDQARTVFYLKGAEMVAQLLQSSCVSSDTSIQVFKYSIEQLQTPLISSFKDFKPRAAFLIRVVKDVFTTCGKDIDSTLYSTIWHFLIGHVENQLDHGERIDFDDVLVPLLFAVKDLIDKCCLVSLPTLNILWKLSKLPPRVLSHPLMSLQTKENRAGTSTIFIAQLLFHPELLKQDCLSYEWFHLAFENLSNASITSSSNQLLQIQILTNLLDKAAGSFANLEGLWRMWSSVCNLLQIHVLKTSDVNQGDALEHNFSAMYSVLSFPYRNILQVKLPMVTVKQLNKSTTDLYRAFSRAAALVSTADANIWVEDFTSIVLKTVTGLNKMDAVIVDGLVMLISTILDCVDWSSSSLFAAASVTTKVGVSSPLKQFHHKHHKPLGNLTCLTNLIAKLLDATYSSTKDLKQPCSNLIAPAATMIINSLSTLFAHVKGSSAIKELLQVIGRPLASYLGDPHTSSKADIVGEKKVITQKFIQKLEKLWSDIMTCIHSRFNGTFDTQLLHIISPLLEITFSHTRRNIKNQSIIFWNATFAHAHYLDYPPKLRSCLELVRKKTPLVLPGWERLQVSLEQASMDITTDSEDTQPRDLAKPPPQTMMSSPRKSRSLSATASPQLKGSFLHKSEKIASPLKNFAKGLSPVARTNNVRRKLPLSLDQDDKEFVTILPSPKKKRLLTEHQKEVLKERSVIPTMYSVLDQSQDCTQFSLMSQSMRTGEPTSPITKDFDELPKAMLPPSTHVTKTKELSPVKVAASDVSSSNTKNKSCPDEMEEKTVKPRAKLTTCSDETDPSKHEICTQKMEENRGERLEEIEQTKLADEDIEHGKLDTEVNKNIERTLDETKPMNKLHVNVEEVSDICTKDQEVQDDELEIPSTPTKEEHDVEIIEETQYSPDFIPSSQSQGSDSSYDPVSRTHRDISNNFENNEITSECIETLLDENVTDNSNPKESVKSNEVNGCVELAAPDSEMKVLDPVCEVTTGVNTGVLTGVLTECVSDVKDEAEVSCDQGMEIEQPNSMDNDSAESSSESVHPVETVKSVKEDKASPIARRTRLKGKQSPGSIPFRKSLRVNYKRSAVVIDSQAEEVEITEETKCTEPAPSSPVPSRVKFIHSTAQAASPKLVRVQKQSSISVVSSPNASPTTGILKNPIFKTNKIDSPSPPKVRRVSFAFPLQESKEITPIEEQLKNEERAALPSPATTPKSSISSSNSTGFTAIKPKRQTKSQDEPQVNPEDCIYPELLDCQTPVAQILPSLASSNWVRGMGHVFSSKHIHTVGQLCALTEVQAENLPIRAPKVQTLRKSLQTFHQNQLKMSRISAKGTPTGNHAGKSILRTKTTPSADKETVGVTVDTLKSVPDVLKSAPEVLKSAPEVLKSAPEVLKSAPDALKSAPEVLKSAPALEVKDMGITKTEEDIVKATDQEIIDTIQTSPPTLKQKSAGNTPKRRSLARKTVLFEDVYDNNNNKDDLLSGVEALKMSEDENVTSDDEVNEVLQSKDEVIEPEPTIKMMEIPQGDVEESMNIEYEKSDGSEKERLAESKTADTLNHRSDEKISSTSEKSKENQSCAVNCFELIVDKSSCQPNKLEFCAVKETEVEGKEVQCPVLPKESKPGADVTVNCESEAEQEGVISHVFPKENHPAVESTVNCGRDSESVELKSPIPKESKPVAVTLSCDEMVVEHIVQVENQTVSEIDEATKVTVDKPFDIMKVITQLSDKADPEILNSLSIEELYKTHEVLTSLLTRTMTAVKMKSTR